MRSISWLLCMVLVALSCSANSAVARDGAERRSNQDSDELRSDMRQRRLKKVQDLDDGQRPSQSAPSQASTGPKPQKKTTN